MNPSTRRDNSLCRPFARLATDHGVSLVPLRRSEPGGRGALARAGEGDQRGHRRAPSRRAESDAGAARRAAAAADRPRVGRVGRCAALGRHAIAHPRLHHHSRPGDRHDDRADRGEQAACAGRIGRVSPRLRRGGGQGRGGRHDRLAADRHAAGVLSRTGRANALPGGARFSRRGAVGHAGPEAAGGQAESRGTGPNRRPLSRR